MSVVFHVPAPFSVANSSTIAFSRNSPSSPDSAPARFRGVSASSSLVSAVFASSSLESAVWSSFTASAFADAFPAPRESFRHQTWVRHRESAGRSGALALVLDVQGKASVIRFLQQQVRQFAFRPISLSYLTSVNTLFVHPLCTSPIPTPLFALMIGLFFKRSVHKCPSP